jgi:hypothetical protein
MASLVALVEFSLLIKPSTETATMKVIISKSITNSYKLLTEWLRMIVTSLRTKI